MFRDRFRKWPRRFKWTVFCCFFMPMLSYAANTHGSVAPSFLTIIVILFFAINVLVVIWGVRLNTFAQRSYWYRNYHLGGATTLALVPLIVLILQYSTYCL
ncbi:hypothetical protein [Grimontia hollisae]|uniref:hypothetical protein n=1 Tax=Grimontia hollisae TaxID=673 RepID=UPI001D02EA64|nr:hypothetical protein [Grimontia hollisae]MDF2184354.1 hypothetical protein [Grimontia hollisae]